MADIQIVMEVLGTESIVSATKSTTKLENTIKSLTNSLDAGRITEKQFNTALKEVRQTLDGNGRSWQANKAYIDRFAKSVKSAMKAQEEAAKADMLAKKEAKDFAKARREAEQANREFDAQRKRDIQTAKQQEAQEERLRHKFVQGHTAMEIYSRELNDIAMARKKNIISAQQQANEVARLNKAYAEGSGVFSRFNQAQMAATKGSNQMGVVTQQAGYQIGDFLVQVQSGTNPLVAFGQQATQLVGVLPLVAGRIGLTTAAAIGLSTALGIGIPLVTAIGAAFWRTSGQAKSATDTFNELSNAISDYADVSERLQDADFSQNFGMFADQAERALAAIKELKTAEINESIRNVLGGELQRRPGAEIPFTTGTIRGAADVLGVGIVTEKDLNLVSQYLSLLDNLQKAKGFDAQVQAADKLSQFIKNNVDLNKLDAEQRENINGLLELTVDLAEQAGKANKDAVSHIEAYNKEQLKFLDKKKKADEEVAKSWVKLSEEQVKLLQAQGKYEEALELAAGLAYDEAKAKVLSTAESEKQRQALMKAAEEAGQLAAEAVRVADETRQAKDDAKAMAKAFSDAAAAMNAMSSSSLNINTQIAQAKAEAAALASGLDVSTARNIAGARSKIEAQYLEASGKAQMAGDLDLMEQAQRIYKEQLEGLTTLEKLSQANAALRDSQKGSSRTTDPIKSGTEYIERVLKPEIALRRKTMLMSDEQRKRAEFEFELRQKIDKYKEKASEKEIQAAMSLYDQAVRLERVGDIIDYSQGQFENFFMTVVDGTSSVEDAFKGMLRNILLEIYRQQVAKPAAEGIGNLLRKAASSFFGGGNTTASANGNIFQNGQVKAFANGGIVSSPTFFPMPNGTGLMGEAGPEAIMPLKRGPNGKLGVEASGGQQVVVNQSFNFAANGDESVKKIIAQAAPQIAQMTQKQIMDSRRRGGQMKAAFS